MYWDKMRILEVRRINKGGGDTHIGQAASFQISDRVKRPKEASGSVSTTFQKLFYYGKFPNYTKVEGKVERKRKKNITPYAHHPASTITNILPILLGLCSPPYLYFKASTRLFHFISPSHFKNVFHHSFCWPVQPSWWQSQRAIPGFHSDPAREAFNQSRLSKNGFTPFSMASVNNHKNEEGLLSYCLSRKNSI